MKILIAGSGGFIGSHLVDYYQAKGYTVCGCDITENQHSQLIYYKADPLSDQWVTIFKEHQFDFCINAAGNGNVNYSVSHPLEDFNANTLETIKILEAIRTHNPGCRYLHISSAAVYGNPVSLPVAETADCNPISPYGWHKLMAEQVCREYSVLHRLRIAVVRPFSIYGPRLRKQLLWDTFQKFKNNPNHIELWGTGNESRDFIHVVDVVRAFDLVLQNAEMNGELYNVASGIETFTKEVIGQLVSYFPGKPVITFNNHTREGDPLNWRADIGRIQRLGFSTSIPIQTGIESLANWYIQYL